MSLPRADTVLELGVGEGALLGPAFARWKDARLITVDIDEHSVSSLLQRYPAHAHFCLDALDLRLPERLELQPRSVDAAVCNPPYIRNEWRPAFSELLEDAGLSGCIPVHRDAAAEVLFLAQNLRLLRDGGSLGIIVPDRIVTGSSMRLLREHLVEEHGLVAVIQLPERIFRKTEAKTYILVLNKKRPSSGQLPLYKLDASGALSRPPKILSEQASERLDFDYFSFSRADLGSVGNMDSRGGASSLPLAPFEIERGSVTNKLSRGRT